MMVAVTSLAAYVILIQVRRLPVTLILARTDPNAVYPDHCRIAEHSQGLPSLTNFWPHRK